MHSFEIGGVAVEASTRAHVAIPFMYAPDGSPLSIPVVVVHGSVRGPVLYLNSATHGDEPEGTLAIIDIAAELDPSILRGTLVGVPVLNAAAFIGKSSVDVTGLRESALDWKNLAAAFPGRSDGTPTERLAYAVCTEILPRVDFAIDFHSGGVRGTSHLLSGFVATEGELGFTSLELARLFPIETLWRTSPWQKFASVCLERNVPVAVIETTGQGRADAEDVDLLKLGIRNVMRFLGMIEGLVQDLPATRKCIDSETYVYASVGGILRAFVHTGAAIDEGQILGVVIDGHGRANEEVRSPLKGIVTGIRTKPVVWAGDTVFLVANYVATPDGSL